MPGTWGISKQTNKHFCPCGTCWLSHSIHTVNCSFGEISDLKNPQVDFRSWDVRWKTVPLPWLARICIGQAHWGGDKKEQKEAAKTLWGLSVGVRLPSHLEVARFFVCQIKLLSYNRTVKKTKTVTCWAFSNPACLPLEATFPWLPCHFVPCHFELIKCYHQSGKFF